MITAFKQYLLTLKLSPVSRKLYLADVRHFLSWLGLEPTLDQLVSTRSYTQYLDSLTAQAIAPSMLKRTLASLKQFGTFIAASYSVANPTTQLSFSDSPANLSADPLNHGKYIKHFLNYLTLEHLSPLTVKSYKSDITRYLDWASTHLAGTKISILLRDKNIKMYLNHLTYSGASLPSTIERKEKSLARFQAWYTQIYSPTATPDNNNSSRLSKFLSNPLPPTIYDLPSVTTAPDVVQNIVKNFNYRTAITFGILLIFTAALAIFGYRQFASDVRLTAAYPSTPVTPNRQVSFQGRLEDAGGTPIPGPTDMIFKFYNSAGTGSPPSGGTELYSTGTCSIDPDADGVFSTQIGSTCGAGITSSVFTENSNVWLEVTVVSQVMDPRQQIATVAYALNSETLQGFPISSTVSAIRNTVVPMNQWGEIIVGEQNPRMTGVSGTFAISAPALSITTTTGTNGNISLAPDGTGQVNVTGNTTTTNFFNVSNAQLTTGSLITGTVGNANTGFKLIDLLSGSSPTSKFSVTDAGNVTLAGDLAITGGNITTTAATFNVANAATTLNLGSTNVTRTINIGTGTSADTINIGTGGTTAETIIIGTTTASNSLALNDDNWNITGAGLANFASIGAATPGTGAFTTLSSTGLATVDADLYVSSGISLYNNAVSDGTVEATQFCTGDGETNCVTDFSAIIAGSGYWTRTAGNLYPTTLNDTISATTSAAVALTLTQTGAFNALLVEDQASDPTPFVIDQSGNVGIGTTGPDAKLDSLATTEQLRLTYTDGTVYSAHTVDSSGNLNIDNTGTKTVIADDLQITGGDILDSNGNESIRFGTTASAVNEVTLTNAAAGGTVLFAATGGDADIALSIDSKGAGALNLNGTATGDILLGGGSGSTGCTLTNSTGNFSCTILIASSIPFSGITSATNTSAAMVVGAGASLDYTSTGTINASSLIGATWVAPGTIGSTTPNTAAFTTLTSNGSTTLGTGSSLTNTLGSGASSINTIGSVTTPGALTLHGATSLDNTFTVSGSNLTSLGGNLTVSGTTWTATPTISGLITATSGLTANGALTANNAFTLGDNGDTGSVDTSDWDISTTGTLTGISGITTDGGYTQSGTIANTFTGTPTFSNATYSALFTGGNVGIGTATPTSKLHVEGAVTGKALAIFNETGDQNIFTASQSGVSVFNLARVAGTAANGTTFTPSATGNAVTQAATGTDTNIAFSLDTKGSGALNLNGTATGDILLGGGSGSTGCTLTNSTGNFSCTILTASALKWNSLTNPDGALTLAHGVNATTFGWTPTGALDAFTMNLVNNGGSSTIQNGLVINNAVAGSFTDVATESLLSLKQLDTTVAGTTALTDALLIDSAGNSGIVDAIHIANTVGNITNGINIADTTGTIDKGLVLSGTFTTAGIDAGNSIFTNIGNANTDFNSSGGLTLAENLVVQGTTGLTFNTGAGGDITFALGEKIDNDVDGTVAITAPITSLSGDLKLTGGDILDSNGNESIRFGTTASAVNEATLTNAATAGTVLFAATGGDADIALSIDSKGADALNLNGTATGDILLGGGSGSTGCTLTNSTGEFTCTILTASALKWNSLTNPDGNLALTMGANTSTFTYNATTGAGVNLFNLTDTISNTGTGYLMNLTTAASSALKPFHVSAAGVEALMVDSTGNVGIGVTNPTSKLQIGGATSTISNSSGNLNIDSFSGSVVFGTDDDLIPTLGAGSADLGSVALPWDNLFATDIDFTAGASTITLKDNTASAFKIVEGANSYFDITTTNTTENISFGNTTINPTFSFLGTGTTTFSGAIAVNGAFTLGDNGETGVIDTSDWDINATGDMTNIGAITADGLLTLSNDATMSGVLTVGNGTTNTIRSPFGPLNLAYKSGLNAWTNGITLQDTTGNVGIGIAAPAEKLEVNGNVAASSFVDIADPTNAVLNLNDTGTALKLAGDILNYDTTQPFSISSSNNQNITINAGTGTVEIGAGGAGKLDAATIDPPYTINGSKFATYVASMTGVKEETTGTITTSQFVAGQGYRATLDLATSPVGSDLWLFSKTTNLKNQLDQLVVLLSASSNTRTWYRLDPATGQLYLYSSTPTTISYRLTAPRFDTNTWSNARDANASSGLIINDENPWSVSETIASAIKSDMLAQADNQLQTQLISPLSPNQPIIISRNPSTIHDLPSFSSDPLLIVDGELTAATISARVAILTDVQADTITARNIVADTIEANHIIGLDAKIASLSAGLTDTEVETITDRIKARLALLTGNTPTATDLPLPAEATASASLPSTIDDLQSTASDSATLAALDADFVTINNYLAVIGQATITTLDITANLYTASINSKTGIINLADSTLIVDSTGQVAINGDLTVTGRILADSGEFNTISLGSPSSATSSALGQLLSIYNEAGVAVATIDASGSANFADISTKLITIASASDASGSATPSGLLTTSTKSNATAGESKLVSPNTELTIESPYITPNSLVYLTPTTNTDNKVLFVKSKNEKSFTVAIDLPANSDISFNWWIIQLKPETQQ